jgi:hypothetical protein
MGGIGEPPPTDDGSNLALESVEIPQQTKERLYAQKCRGHPPMDQHIGTRRKRPDAFGIRPL